MELFIAFFVYHQSVPLDSRRIQFLRKNGPEERQNSILTDELYKIINISYEFLMLTPFLMLSCHYFTIYKMGYDLL